MKNKFKIYFPYIILILLSLALLARAFLSFCWSDETLYVSTAYRFIRGDRIFADEWFPTQLSSVILVPLMALYITITGSASGILLFFRIVYVVLSLALSIAAYRILSEDVSPVAAFISAVSMLFYAHLNIATTSYYMISVQFFLIAMLLIYHYLQKGGHRRSLLIVSGALFAISVLALPTMALAYIAVAIALVALLALGRFSPKLSSLTSENHIGRILLYTFVGICIPAFVFFVFLLCNVSVHDFINAIPYVLSDEEHGTSLIFPIRKMFISLNEVYHKAAYIWYLLVICCIAFRKKLMKVKYRKLVFGFDALLFIILAIYSFGHTGYIQSAVCMFALPLFILTKKRDNRLFVLLYVSGMIFSLVYSYSSNGFLYVLSTGHAIASVSAIASVFDFAEEVRADLTQDGHRLTGFAITFTCATILFYMLACTVTLRMINVYRDAPLDELTCKITKGPAAGLYTTAAHADSYNTVIDAINAKCTSDALGRSGNLLITKLLPFGYMCTDLRVAAPTCWRNNINSSRLSEYYNVNPDRLPDIILLLNDDIGSYESCGDVEADPIPNANEFGGFLDKYISENDFSCEEVACGKIYTRR